LGANAPVSAGNYTVTATYAGDANHAASFASFTFTVKQAAASITVTPYTVSYDGGAHTAVGSASGIGGMDLSAGLALIGTTPTHPGNYTDTWVFTDPAGNYQSAIGKVEDGINRAEATIAVTPYSVTYDGTRHVAMGTAVGAVGESLGGLLIATTTHTNAGIYV